MSGDDFTQVFGLTQAGKPTRMVRARDGVWRADGRWVGMYYTFVVRCFTRATGRVEECETSDPYSRVL